MLQTTDGWVIAKAIANIEREREFTFAKIMNE